MARMERTESESRAADFEILKRTLETALKNRQAERSGTAAEVQQVTISLESSLDPSLGTEALLNNLIIVCHTAMRNVALHLAAGASDPFSCRQYLSETMGLARAGACVGKTIAMLRAADRYAEQGTYEPMGKVIPAIDKNG